MNSRPMNDEWTGISVRNAYRIVYYTRARLTALCPGLPR